MGIVPAGSSAIYQDNSGSSGFKRRLQGLGDLEGLHSQVTSMVAQQSSSSSHQLRETSSANQSLEGRGKRSWLQDLSAKGRALLWPGDRTPAQQQVPLDTLIATGQFVPAGNTDIQTVLIPASATLPQFVLSYVQHYVYFGAYLQPLFGSDFFSNGASR